MTEKATSENLQLREGSTIKEQVRSLSVEFHTIDTELQILEDVLKPLSFNKELDLKMPEDNQQLLRAAASPLSQVLLRLSDEAHDIRYRLQKLINHLDI